MLADFVQRVGGEIEKGGHYLNRPMPMAVAPAPVVTLQAPAVERAPMRTEYTPIGVLAAVVLSALHPERGELLLRGGEAQYGLPGRRVHFGTAGAGVVDRDQTRDEREDVAGDIAFGLGGADGAAPADVLIVAVAQRADADG